MRVILDPNILISHLLPSRHETSANRVVDAAILGLYQLLISDELVHELITRVQRKPFLQQRITSIELTALVMALSTAATHVDLSNAPIHRVVRDPDDDYLIALALAGHADVLVSGDDDLHDIAALMPFRILSLRAFADLLAEEAPPDQQW